MTLLQHVQNFDYHTNAFQNDVIVYLKGKDIFVSCVSEMRSWDEDELDLEELEGVKVNKEDVFPRFEKDKFTVAHTSDPDSCYVKRSCIADYTGKKDGVSKRITTILQREATVCEAIRRAPHENIATYHGCVVDEGLIVALCLEKYPCTLREKMEQGIDTSAKLGIYRQICNAVSHLHSLGYCHNDVHDRNIMITEGGQAVLIDFDSSLPEGEIMAYKGGAPEWSEDSTVSKKENDYFSLRKLREYLSVKEDEAMG